MEPRNGTIAFFDLDRTLLDANSGLLWARHELRRRNIGRWQFARAAWWSLMYHLSFIDMPRMYTEALSHYAGQRAGEIQARTRAWFEAEIAVRLRPGARAALDEHRAAGDWLVLLTNSSPYEAQVATETWGLDDWLANDFHTDTEGFLVGTFEPPLCFGDGKVVRAQRWAESHERTLEGAYFYTDSLSDLPMLECVGNPRVVHPDPRLRRVARERGWPILDWSGSPGDSRHR